MNVFAKCARPAVTLVALASCVDAFVAPRPAARCLSPRPSALSSDRAELRALRVKELQAELGKRNIRWQTFLEKEELVVALSNALLAEASFSASGAMAPGVVAELTAEQFELELAGDPATPILLDVYAKWCGPCQMMAPQLAKAAEELGAAARVAKVDSDLYEALASTLNVGGLPTVILFKGGKEVDRVEGALMKDQLVAFAKSAADVGAGDACCPKG
jgi:thioredoxin